MTTCRCGQPAQPDDYECERCEAFAQEAQREEPREPERPHLPHWALQHLHPHVGVQPGMAGEVRDTQGTVLAQVTCAALDAGPALPLTPAFEALRGSWLLVRTSMCHERTLPEVLAVGRPMRHLHGQPTDAWAWSPFWARSFFQHALPTDRTQRLGLGERIVVWFPRATWQDQLRGLESLLVCPTCGWLRPDCHCGERQRAARESCW